MVTLLVPFPDGAVLEFVYSLGGRVCTNRLWMLNRQPPNTTVQLQALAEAASSYWTANVLPLLSSDVRLELVRATSWDLSSPIPTGSVAPATNGGVAEPTYSASVAARIVFDWPIDVRLRVGGNFVPGLPDSAVAGNLMSTSFQAELREAYNGVIDAAFGWGDTPAWRWVNASLQEGNAPRATAFARRVIGTRTPSPYVNPQRHRVKPLPS